MAADAYPAGPAAHGSHALREQTRAVWFIGARGDGEYNSSYFVSRKGGARPWDADGHRLIAASNGAIPCGLGRADATASQPIVRVEAEHGALHSARREPKTRLSETLANAA